MAPTKLKIKGNKAFSLLSTIDTDEDLSKTWRLMTKVKDALEYGMRLENLSWRLWFMHHLMVHDQKTRNQFKRLSNATTKKLEIEKATELKDLSAPSYRPKSQDNIVVEKKGKKKATKKPSTPVMQSKKNNQKNLKNSKPTESIQNDDFISNNNNDESDNNNDAISNDTKMELEIVKDDEKNITNVTSITDSTTLEIDENILVNVSHDVSHDDTEGVLTSMNDSRSLEDIWNDVHSFSLRQYTSDQDPFQVVSLPSIFDRINAQALLHPNHQPIMQLDLDQMIGVYNISPEHSEPNSPTMEWYENNILPPDTITQQTSNLQFSMPNSSLSPGIHGAVYVPRTTGGSPVNSSINSNLIASINTSSNGLSNNNNLLNGVSNSNIIYMNQYVSEQPTPSNNSSISPGHATTSKINSISTSPSSSMDSSNINTRTSSSSSTESKPKKAHASGEQQCFNCGVTSTPLWRRSANDELLCNACGLYLKLHKMDRPKTMKPHIVRKDARDDEAAQPVCSNCNTMTTPLWRRDEEGQTLCNACGLYFKLHHERRPLSMKTDVIKKRQRYENGQTPNRRKKQRSPEPEQDVPQQQQPPPPPPPPPSQQQIVPVFGGHMGVTPSSMPRQSPLNASR
ncbi:glucocorticoid receptor-like DNA-binding domain [Gigaspora margarita]|uniref:Glucocorticoid receptor-like DNA-binding domain n=1 Tax=Gigaspora margarita TaxID=4874 RepID=A0A8H3XKB2_GIGMA|nr:glucocorticoid receptor-like DNA-binding domain [Gigaspora margarita]